MPDVFVNYRTGDGDQAAALIERELSHRFGEGSAFRASASIKAGAPFPRELLQGVRRSAVLLAVIGPGWTRCPDLRRKDDWVHREMAEAFHCAIPVVPVLLGRETKRLKAADLPEDLAQLADVQSLRLDMQNANADLLRIGDELADLVPSLAADRSAPPEPEAAPGSVHNSVGEVNGTAVQTGHFSGDAGTVIKDNRGSVHTGSGNFYENSRHYQDSQHFSGDGATHVAGDNHGGIHHRFGEDRRKHEEDER